MFSENGHRTSVSIKPPVETHPNFAKISVEGLEFIGLDWGLVLVQVCQWVLRPIVVSIVVSIDRLCLQTRNRVKFLDGCRTQARQSTKHGTLNFRDLSIFHSIHQ